MANKIYPPPPKNRHKLYTNFTQLATRLFCLFFVLVLSLSLFGCNTESHDAFIFCEHIGVRFVLFDTDETIFTHDNIVDIKIEFNDTLNCWRLVFYLDADGTLSLAYATAPENQGKHIHIFIALNGEETLASAPMIGGQILDGIVPLSGLGSEQRAQNLFNQLSGNHCWECNPPPWLEHD